MSTKKSWMKDNVNIIKNIPINKLCLLGSHDSGTYDISSIYISRFTNWVSTILVVLSGNPLVALLKHGVIAYIQGWVRTQPSNLKDQLNRGVRYFDLRVTNDGEQIYTAHSFLTAKLENILKDIQSFLNDSRDEILLLDIQDLDFGDRHDELMPKFIALIKQYIPQEKYAVSDDKKLTYSQLIATSKRVFIFLKDGVIERSNTLDGTNIFISREDNLNSEWYNTTSKSDLKKAIEKNLANRSDSTRFQVIQTVLTPNAAMVIKGLNPTPGWLPFGSYSSIERAAKNLNGDAKGWFKDWAKSDEKRPALNVLMIDWVDNESFIDMVIDINKKKAEKY